MDLHSILQLYDDWLKQGDPRVQDWLLMSSPFPQTLIIMVYIYFVKFLGPRLMETRKPFELKTVMIIYNVNICAFCLYMFHENQNAACLSPGGMSTFQALMNSGVHVIMYSYYALAAMGPAYRTYLWWKKYLTIIQLTQFAVVMMHLSQIFLIWDCHYQCPWTLYILCVLEIIFVFLFLDFYYRAYIKRRKQPKRAVV
ncbi:hypothetical protein ACEWY4_004862 [Coilia grayii]|uniref:Elongation of very long chain fatty acids protein n=1 Tax=Coilia grayii TaxID=363190 RepID=A0ABD1KMS7_9TELE